MIESNLVNAISKTLENKNKIYMYIMPLLLDSLALFNLEYFNNETNP